MTRWFLMGIPLGDFLTLLLVVGTWLLAVVTAKLAFDTREGNRAMLELQRKEISARLCLSLLPKIEDPEFTRDRRKYFNWKKAGAPLPADLFKYYTILDHLSALIRSGVVSRDDVAYLLFENPWDTWPTIEEAVQKSRESQTGPRYLENMEWVAKNP